MKQVMLLRCTQLCKINVIKIQIGYRANSAVGKRVVPDLIYLVIPDMTLLFGSGSYPSNAVFDRDNCFVNSDGPLLRKDHNLLWFFSAPARKPNLL